MNAPPPKRSPPGKRISIALAVVVHLVLAAFLIYGIRWQTKAPEAVEVELVKAAPTPMPAPPAPEPAPPPAPKPEPKPAPKPAPPPPKKPDIAVKEKPKTPPRETKPLLDHLSDLLRREDEALAARRAEQAAAQEAARKQQAEAAAARGRAVADYSERIRMRIHGNIVLPPEIKGNPVAKFRVAQLPSGDIIEARKISSSGHAGYDAAVERAILKSSPLPRPADPSLFESRLDLTFCPQEPCQ